MSFQFLGFTLPWIRVVALCEALLQTLLKGTETQWLLLSSVQIFQAVSKTTTLRDFFKQSSNFGRKCEFKKCVSLHPVITDELCLCPGTMGYQFPLGSSFPNCGSRFPIPSDVPCPVFTDNSLESGNSKKS